MKPGHFADWTFAVTVAGVGAVYLLGVYRPQLREIELQQRKIVTTRGEISRSEAFMHGLDDLESYLKEFEGALTGLDRLVPVQSVADERFREVVDVAERCHLHYNVRPDPLRPNGSIVAHPVVVKVTGTFPAVQRFMFEAEALPRHTRVTRFLVQGTIPGQSPGDVTAEIELTSYSVATAAGGSS